jgi:choline/glycine/proline betaine transport protein
MPIKPPVTDLPIRVAKSGFYRGFTKDVTITAKILVGGLILWAIAFPDQAASVLGAMNSIILASFNYWYVYSVAFFLILCFVLALWPTAGRMKFGVEEDEPEFTNFSWFSMMFGAGIGIGMLTFATAEPMYHFAANPSDHSGPDRGQHGRQRARRLHLVIHPLGSGRLGLLRHRRLGAGVLLLPARLPLTIRSALTPIFGRNCLARSATWLISSPWLPPSWVCADAWFRCRTVHLRTVAHRLWRLALQRAEAGERSSSTLGIIFALVVIMGASTLSALSGVGKGIKWLSNINMGLSFFVLAFFLMFGSTFFGAAGTCSRHLRLSGVDPGQHLHGLGGRWHRDRRCPGRMAGWLDHLLLGLVDRVCPVCRRVPCPNLQRPHDP